jgi:hypothetical protein
MHNDNKDVKLIYQWNVTRWQWEWEVDLQVVVPNLINIVHFNSQDACISWSIIENYY